MAISLAVEMPVTLDVVLVCFCDEFFLVIVVDLLAESHFLLGELVFFDLVCFSSFQLVPGGRQRML